MYLQATQKVSLSRALVFPLDFASFCIPFPSIGGDATHFESIYRLASPHLYTYIAHGNDGFSREEISINQFAD